MGSLLLKEEELPNVPTKNTEHKAIEYINLVFEGYDKVKAYKEVFPERYNSLEKKAISNKRNVRATIISAINMYERGKYVSSLYGMANEQYYARFVNKRTSLLEKLYDIGMDDEEKMSHRLVAAKTFLSSIPEPKKEVVHKVEVDVQDEFQKKLREKQQMLYNAANSEQIEDAIVIDEGVEADE